MKRRKLKILLVEPPYRSSIVPYSLQKFATFHLDRGDKVDFSHNPLEDFSGIWSPGTYNRIYVTSVFTYHGQITIDTINFLKRKFPKSKIRVGGVFASLLSDLVKEKTGITPHVGLYYPIENCLPNFSVFPKQERGYLVTSRGCIHKCAFCAVKSIEPKFFTVENWKNQMTHIYNQGIRYLCIQDNNFLATPKSHQKEVIRHSLQHDGMEIDFNQALEAKLYTSFKSKNLVKANMPILRFAFDNMEEDGYFQDAVKRARHDGFKGRITAYILYNFTDTPEDFYYRLVEAWKLGCSIHPMRYCPLTSINKKYIGEHWTPDMLRGFSDSVSLVSTTGSSKEYPKVAIREERWKRDFGENAEDFVNRISNYKQLLPSKNAFSKEVKNRRSTRIGLGFIDKSDIKQRQKAIKDGIINVGNKNTTKRDYKSKRRKA